MNPTGPAMDQPNILFVVCDQLRARSLGCYGDTQVHTPNLDALAARGVRFNAAYSTYPVCTPARASLQSGLMPTACHVVWNNQTLEPEYPCLAEYLGAAGYATAYIGKWHLGGYEGPQGEDYHLPIKATHRHGWKDLFIVTHGEDYRPEKTPIIIGDRHDLRVNEWQIPWVTDQAVEFLGRQTDARPWVLNLHYAIPHDPYFMPEPFKSMYRPEDLSFPPNAPESAIGQFRQEMADYYGLTSWLDHEIGRLMKGLQARQGKRRTVIVFTSDHGWNLGSHGLPAKFSLYEESAGIPLIIADPAARAGAVCREPVSLVDLLPTLLDMAHLSATAPVHGTSLVPLLSGTGPWTRQSIFMQIVEHPRHNLQRWDPPSRGVRSKRYKYIERRDRKLLFDLQDDPFEMNDIVARPDMANVVNELHRELHDWIRRTGDPWPACDTQGVYYSVNTHDNPFGEMQAHN